jgi:protoheme IX farnesyltransferase
MPSSTASSTPAKAAEQSAKAAPGIWRDMAALVKLRLSSIVVFSAGIGYLLATASGAAEGVFSYAGLAWLMLGGLLVTGAANALNEIIERDTDAKMERTSNRPLPTGRMGVGTALIAAGTFGIVGVAILWSVFNPTAALLGALALLSYAFIYTPMKRMGSFAVFVGAIPGAIPPAIGWTAATGNLGTGALILFAIQFFWQFPHFWAIAWMAKDDYAKAGFDLLPDASGRSRRSALHILAYTVVLIPLGMLPYWAGMSGLIGAGVAVLCGSLFTLQALRLLQRCELKDARALLFGSFAYLPIVFAALVLDAA